LNFGNNFVELCSTRAFICATKINNSTKKGIAIFFGKKIFIKMETTLVNYKNLKKSLKIFVTYDWTKQINGECSLKKKFRLDFNN